MTNTQVLTLAGVSAAAVLLLLSAKSGSPLGAVSPQPAQRDRDAALAAWLNFQNNSFGIFGQAIGQSAPSLSLIDAYQR